MNSRRQFFTKAVLSAGAVLAGVEAAKPKFIAIPRYSWPPVLKSLQFFPETNMKAWEPYILRDRRFA